MCDQIPLEAHGTGLEIGIGQGYHACVLASRCPQLRIRGFEANISIAQHGVDLANRWGNRRVEILADCFDENQSLREEYSLAYHTVAHPIGRLVNIAEAVADSGRYLYLRPLTIEEYSMRPIDMWLHRMYKGFDEYKVHGWARICVLVSGKKEGGTVNEVRRIFGVRFVSWQDTVQNDIEPVKNDGLSILLTL